MNQNNIIRTRIVGQSLGSVPAPDPSKPGFLLAERCGGTPLQLTPDLLSTGALLLGGTGSGKSNVYKLLLRDIVNSLNANDILLIFDPKGEFEPLVHRFNRDRHKVIVISSDPAEKSAHWNIFEELLAARAEERELIAREIAAGLFAAEMEAQQPFFGIAAAELLTCVLLCRLQEAKETGNYSRLNNQDLLHFLDTATVATFHRLIAAHPEYQYIESYIGAPGSQTTNQALGVLGVLLATLHRVLVGNFAARGNPFSVNRLVRSHEKTGRIVLLKYLPRYQEALKTVLSFLVNQFIKETLSLPDNSRNTWLVLDECAMLPFLVNLPDAVNFGRSRGVKTIAGLQSISQLKAGYGDEALPIAAGFTTCLAFRCTDEESRRYISERFGKCFDNYTFVGQQIQNNGYVVDDGMQRELGVGDVYADLPSQPPFLFHFAEFK